MRSDAYRKPRGAMGSSPTRAASGRRLTALRSEEHTSELQSQSNLVCRLLLEKKKKINCLPNKNCIIKFLAIKPLRDYCCLHLHIPSALIYMYPTQYIEKSISYTYIQTHHEH